MLLTTIVHQEIADVTIENAEENTLPTATADTSDIRSRSDTLDSEDTDSRNHHEDIQGDDIDGEDIPVAVDMRMTYAPVLTSPLIPIRSPAAQAHGAHQVIEATAACRDASNSSIVDVVKAAIENYSSENNIVVSSSTALDIFNHVQQFGVTAAETIALVVDSIVSRTGRQVSTQTGAWIPSAMQPPHVSSNVHHNESTDDPSDEDVSACYEQVQHLFQDTRTHFWSQGNLYPDEATVKAFLLGKLNRSSTFAVGGYKHRVFQKLWSEGRNVGRDKKASLWAMYKKASNKALYRRRGKAIDAYFISLKMPLPIEGVPRKKQEGEKAENVRKLYKEMEDEFSKVSTALATENMHRVLRNNNQQPQPVGNEAFHDACLALLDAAQLIDFKKDQGSGVYTGVQLSEYYKQVSTFRISHLQLGCVSEAVRNAVTKGYVDAKHHKGTGEDGCVVGVSKVKAIVEEAEKIWEELKVS